MKILGICGKLQSGKSSSCNFLAGYTLKKEGKTEYFKLNDKGDLIVQNEGRNANGEIVKGEGILDITRTDWEFSKYAEHNIWPHVRMYSMAEPLKIILVEVFGLTYEQCFGTNEQKNSITHIKWSDFRGVVPKNKLDQLQKQGKHPEFVTGREFMQIFGTEICRKIYADCWARNCIKRIVSESPGLALIPDIRFPNELKYIKEAGGKVILLTRKIEENNVHDSEALIDTINPQEFDYIIDNTNATMDQKNNEILVALNSWGWL